MSNVKIYKEFTDNLPKENYNPWKKQEVPCFFKVYLSLQAIRNRFVNGAHSISDIKLLCPESVFY